MHRQQAEQLASWYDYGIHSTATAALMSKLGTSSQKIISLTSFYVFLKRKLS